jgi:uncharacterized protein with PIN domain
MSDTILIIIFVIVVILVVVIQNEFQKRCPKCRNISDVEEMKRENMGDFLPPNNKDTYRITYYCHHCNHRWSKYVEENSD